MKYSKDQPMNIWKHVGAYINTVATDVLVLKLQAINIHNADLLCNAFDQFHKKTT